MNEYMRLWDNTDELAVVNAAAAEGWCVIACFSDDRRGTQFIVKRLNGEASDALPVGAELAGVHVADPNGRPY